MKTRGRRVAACSARNVVEAVGHALADLVHREPHHVLHVERVRMQHAPRGRDDVVLRVLVAEGVALARVDLAEVDVQPHEVAAFARDEQDVALVRRLDRGLQPDVRKVGDGEHVDHAPARGWRSRRAAPRRSPRAPGCARRRSRRRTSRGRRLARRLATSRSVTTTGYSPVGLDLQRDELEAVVGLEPGRRLAHVVEQVLLHPRLVDDDVRQLRQAVLGVLDAAGANDARAVLAATGARRPSR